MSLLYRAGVPARRTIKKCLYLLLIFVFYGCAYTAPVQEMSDARQALQSAKLAGAPQYANRQYQDALKLLEQAEYWLEQKIYATARQFALDARDEAISAREIALSNAPP